MAVQRILDMRRQALCELTEYRRNCLALRRDGQKERQQTRAWLKVIACAREALMEEEPLKGQFMTQMFGLDHAIPRRKTARERLLMLAREMNCAEATLYNWRAEIVELVLYGAIEEGLIRPFQEGRGGRARKKTI